MPQLPESRTITMLAVGGITSISTTEVVDYYNLIPHCGAINLAADIIISTTGALVDGLVFNFNYFGNVTNVTGSVIIFGVTLTPEQMLSSYLIRFQYNTGTASFEHKIFFSENSTGNPSITGGNIPDGSLTGAAFVANTIPYAKTVNGTARGYAQRAGVSGVWEEFNAKNTGYVLLGNGADLVSVPMSGNATIDGTGALTIGPGQITSSMLQNPPSNYLDVSIVMSAADVATSNSAPLLAILAPGTGKYIEIVSATSIITYGTTPYIIYLTLMIINDTANVAQLEDTAALASTISRITKFKPVTSATAAQTQVLKNTAIKIKTMTANPAIGDSAITVNITYIIRTI